MSQTLDKKHNEEQKWIDIFSLSQKHDDHPSQTDDVDGFKCLCGSGLFHQFEGGMEAIVCEVINHPKIQKVFAEFVTLVNLKYNQNQKPQRQFVNLVDFLLECGADESYAILPGPTDAYGETTACDDGTVVSIIDRQMFGVISENKYIRQLIVEFYGEFVIEIELFAIIIAVLHEIGHAIPFLLFELMSVEHEAGFYIESKLTTNYVTMPVTIYRKPKIYKISVIPISKSTIPSLNLTRVSVTKENKVKPDANADNDTNSDCKQQDENGTNEKAMLLLAKCARILPSDVIKEAVSSIEGFIAFFTLFDADNIDSITSPVTDIPKAAAAKFKGSINRNKIVHCIKSVYEKHS